VFVEEIVVLLIQFVVEILLQAVVYLPFDFSFYRDEKSGERSGCGWMSVYVILGGGVGALSLLIAPRLLLDSIALRVGNLVLAPWAAGGLSWASPSGAEGEAPSCALAAISGSASGSRWRSVVFAWRMPPAES